MGFHFSTPSKPTFDLNQQQQPQPPRMEEEKKEQDGTTHPPPPPSFTSTTQGDEEEEVAFCDGAFSSSSSSIPMSATARRRLLGKKVRANRAGPTPLSSVPPPPIRSPPPIPSSSSSSFVPPEEVGGMQTQNDRMDLSSYLQHAGGSHPPTHPAPPTSSPPDPLFSIGAVDLGVSSSSSSTSSSLSSPNKHNKQRHGLHHRSPRKPHLRRPSYSSTTPSPPPPPIGSAPAPQPSSPLQGKAGFDLSSSFKNPPPIPAPPVAGGPGLSHPPTHLPTPTRGEEEQGHHKVGSEIGMEQDTTTPSPGFVFGGGGGGSTPVGEEDKGSPSMEESSSGGGGKQAPVTLGGVGGGGEEEVAFSLGSSKPVTPTKGGVRGPGGRHHHHPSSHHHHHRAASTGSASSSSSSSSSRRPRGAAAPVFGATSSSSSSMNGVPSTEAIPTPGAFKGFTTPPNGASSSSSSSSSTPLPPPYDTQRELQQAAQTFREKASSLYLGKRYEDSLHEFTNALLLAPDGWLEKPKLYCNRAAALIMLHQYEEAIKDCEKAIKGTVPVSLFLFLHLFHPPTHLSTHPTTKGDPHLLKAYTRCGRAYLHMGTLERAYTCFDEVRRRAEHRLLTKFGPDTPLPPPPPPPPTPSGSATHPQRAAQHERKSLDEAIQEAKDGRAEVYMVEQALKDAEAHSRKAEWSEALERVDAALRFAHRAKNAMRLKLVALCKLKRWEDGVRFCEKYYAPTKAELLGPALSTTPTQPPTAGGGGESPGLVNPNPHSPVNVVVRMGSLEQRSYIRCLRYTDREEDAVTALKALLTRHGHVMWVQKELLRIQQIRQAKESGDKAFREQRFDLALGHYAEALKLDPEWDMMNAVLHCNRGAAHMALRLFEDAKEDCTHALRRKPDYWKAFLRRARALRELRRWAESMADYETYLRHTQQGPRPGGGAAAAAGGVGSEAGGAPGTATDVRTELEWVRRELQREKERKEAAKAHQQQQFRWRGGPTVRGFGRGGRGAGYRVDSPFGEEDDADGSDMEEEEEEEEEEEGAGIFQDFFEFYRRHNREGERGSGYSARGNRGMGAGRSASSSSSSSSSSSRPSAESGSSSGYGSQQHRRGYNFSGNSTNNTGASGGRSRPGWGRSRSASSVSASVVTTHYTILGVERVASSAEIKRAFHRLALKYHPDKNKEAGAEEMFKKVSEAYNVLSDHNSRSLYDSDLRVGGGLF